jgi:serine/threonine protein kinase
MWDLEDRVYQMSQPGIPSSPTRAATAPDAPHPSLGPGPREPHPVGRMEDLIEKLCNRAPSTGKRIGRFQIKAVLGAGGMSTVYRAYDPRLDRDVALKLLNSEFAKDHASRLGREAKALARLSHPNVVQLYEVGEAEGAVFIVMELVEGQTLRRWRQKVRHWRECLDAYMQAGRGLAAAHVAGLTHRDFKPDNCIIDRNGRVRVLDFGLVRGIDGHLGNAQFADGSYAASPGPVEEQRTATGVILGTPAYMPPEQLRGERADARSDQFSYCMSLFEALYGRFPCASNTPPKPPVNTPPQEAGNRVPSEVCDILQRGLKPEPELRWPSMNDLLERLESVRRPRRISKIAIFSFLVIPTALGIALTLSRGGDETEWSSFKGTIGADVEIGSGWMDFGNPIQLPKGTKLRLTLGGDAECVAIRLLEASVSPDMNTGVVHEEKGLPSNRVIDFVIGADYENVIQLSVHGRRPWNHCSSVAENGAATITKAEYIFPG